MKTPLLITLNGTLVEESHQLEWAKRFLEPWPVPKFIVFRREGRIQLDLFEFINLLDHQRELMGRLGLAGTAFLGGGNIHVGSNSQIRRTENVEAIGDVIIEWRVKPENSKVVQLVLENVNDLLKKVLSSKEV